MSDFQCQNNVCLAMGTKDWAPKFHDTTVRVVRFTDSLLAESVETHMI